MQALHQLLGAWTLSRPCCCACSDVGLFKKAMGGGGDSDDSAVTSDHEPPEMRPDQVKRKDYTRGLAQRATDPDYAERQARGPFVVSSCRYLPACLPACLPATATTLA